MVVCFDCKGSIQITHISDSLLELEFDDLGESDDFGESDSVTSGITSGITLVRKVILRMGCKIGFSNSRLGPYKQR